MGSFKLHSQVKRNKISLPENKPDLQFYTRRKGHHVEYYSILRGGGGGGGGAGREDFRMYAKKHTLYSELQPIYSKVCTRDTLE